MEQRLSLVTLGVADLARSARFYEEGLGWRRGNAEEGVVFFQMPGALLGLYPLKALAEDIGVDPGAVDAGFRGVTLAYNARSRVEVDAVLAEAAAAGGVVVKDAEEVFWGGYSGYFTDPDGHYWEVAHNPFWTIDDDGRVRLGA